MVLPAVAVRVCLLAGHAKGPAPLPGRGLGVRAGAGYSPAPSEKPLVDGPVLAEVPAILDR